MFLKYFMTVSICFISSISSASGFFSDLGKTFTEAFDKEGIIILAAGTGATLIAFSQDQTMHDAWVNYQRMSPTASQIGDFAGRGYLQVGIAAGQLIWDKENGLAHTQALIASTAVTYGLKYSTQRPRPESDNRTSFPSGHTQITFASATSLYSSYGLKVGAPFYGLAVLTGLSRLADNAHWFSDVVAGATIGILFGRSAYKNHMIISPMAVERGRGLQLTYFFD